MPGRSRRGKLRLTRQSAEPQNKPAQSQGIPLMRTSIRAITAGLLALSAAACTTGPVNSIWTEPTKAPVIYRKLLVLGVANNDMVRFAYEDNFVTALSKRGIESTASHHLRPNANSIDPEQIQQKAQSAGADAIVVTHLIAENGDTEILSLRANSVPANYLQFGGYLHASDETIKKPAYYSGASRLKLEANLYDAKRAALVWSGRSRALKPDSEQATIRQIIEDLIKQLEADGYLPKPPTSVPID